MNSSIILAFVFSILSVFVGLLSLIINLITTQEAKKMTQYDAWLEVLKQANKEIYRPGKIVWLDAPSYTPTKRPCQWCGCADDVTCEECKKVKGKV